MRGVAGGARCAVRCSPNYVRATPRSVVLFVTSARLRLCTRLIGFVMNLFYVHMMQAQIASSSNWLSFSYVLVKCEMRTQ